MFTKKVNLLFVVVSALVFSNLVFSMSDQRRCELCRDAILRELQGEPILKELENESQEILQKAIRKTNRAKKIKSKPDADLKEKDSSFDIEAFTKSKESGMKFAEEYLGRVQRALEKMRNPGIGDRYDLYSLLLKYLLLNWEPFEGREREPIVRRLHYWVEKCGQECFSRKKTMSNIVCYDKWLPNRETIRGAIEIILNSEREKIGNEVVATHGEAIPVIMGKKLAQTLPKIFGVSRKGAQDYELAKMIFKSLITKEIFEMPEFANYESNQKEYREAILQEAGISSCCSYCGESLSERFFDCKSNTCLRCPICKDESELYCDLYCLAKSRESHREDCIKKGRAMLERKERKKGSSENKNYQQKKGLIPVDFSNAKKKQYVRCGGSGTNFLGIDLDQHIKKNSVGQDVRRVVGQVEYIQLDTVNQGNLQYKDEKVNIYQQLNQKARRAKLNEDRTNPYDSGGTCPSQSIRNGMLINNFLKTRDQTHLENIKNDSAAIDYLSNLIKENRHTSWLNAGEVQARLRELNLLGEITVIDSMRDHMEARLGEIAAEFEENDNFSHVFIVNTQDIGLRHFYTLAICKFQNNIKCFIMDTLGGRNHLADGSLQFALNKCLCDSIVDSASYERHIDEYKTRLNPYSPLTANIADYDPDYDEYLKGELLSDEDGQGSTKSPLMLQRRKLSEDLVDSIYSSCSEVITNIVDSCKYPECKMDRETFGDSVPRVVLLHGANGNGKSDIAIAISQKTNRGVPYFVKSVFVESMYQSSGSMNLSNLINPLLKKKAGCVVVFDEVDALLSKKDNKKGKTCDAVVSGILDAAYDEENSEILFVITLNDIENIGEKLKSRIGKEHIINVPLPDKDKRETIIDYYMEKHFKNTIYSSKLNTEIIANQTKGYSARDTVNLLKAIHRKAVQVSKKNKSNNAVLTLECFNETLSSINSSNATLKRASIFKRIATFCKDHHVLSIAATGAAVIIGTATTIVLFFVGNKRQAMQTAKVLAAQTAQAAKALAEAKKGRNQAALIGGGGIAVGGLSLIATIVIAICKK